MTIYNLAPATVQKIQGEFTKIVLEAGYEHGDVGIIFQGTIKQINRSRQKNVDSVLEIEAADGDELYNFGLVNKTLAAGSTPSQQFDAITLPSAYSDGLPHARDVKKVIDAIAAQKLPRGKVMFGMVRDHARDWAAKNNVRWSIQNGEAVLVPVTGYLPGEAVALWPEAGLIGTPTVSDKGVQARILLNPRVRIGGLVQIRQADIDTTPAKPQSNTAGASPATATAKATTKATAKSTAKATPKTTAKTTAAGFYRVLVCEHSGDNRGTDWYSDLTCVAVDTSAPPDSSVLAAG
ncbi:hypothetical protein LFL96_31270 [Paraburkholderia sp. D15]|uniref:hypothetical protein n=1 Tax=Paraburkholderia sp. D15 TaxID=2880218 RepID=UPI00247A6D71|nr:hypothetical protein [Paraburkholderia sp. D15]WGS52667.1 hypothetical protein LFL96_31270 [Paraburkholderia sp. D15]